MCSLMYIVCDVRIIYPGIDSDPFMKQPVGFTIVMQTVMPIYRVGSCVGRVWIDLTAGQFPDICLAVHVITSE